MSNLIITVIAIALTAVAALMGAYYGGTAFIDGQAKSEANRIMSEVQQIGSAWRLYALNHGGAYTLTDVVWYDGTMADLVPDYLSSISKYATYSALIKIDSNGTYTYASTDSNFLEIYIQSKKVCEQLQLINSGTTAIATDVSITTVYNSAKPGYCFYSSYGPGYYFYYRAY